MTRLGRFEVLVGQRTISDFGDARPAPVPYEPGTERGLYMGRSAIAFAQLLHRLVDERPNGARRVPFVELDAIDVLSLLAAASWNVNFMILDRFLWEIGFRRQGHVHRAFRLSAGSPIVVLMARFARGPQSAPMAHLVFAESGRYRAAAAFLEDAVAFVRRGDVVTYPTAALDDSALADSSLYVRTPEISHRFSL